ncbi:MAG: RNA-binding protein [Desulfobacterales bacterium]|nr:RNA-binding protein [Desulfobacterales bacterium]
MVPPMTTLYVGNLPFSATEAEIRGLFEQHGAVDAVKIINDRESGRPRGFCIRRHASRRRPEGHRRVSTAHAMNGRPLRVNEARERPRAVRAAVRRAAASAGSLRGRPELRTGISLDGHELVLELRRDRCPSVSCRAPSGAWFVKPKRLRSGDRDRPCAGLAKGQRATGRIGFSRPVVVVLSFS